MGPGCDRISAQNGGGRFPPPMRLSDEKHCSCSRRCTASARPTSPGGRRRAAQGLLPGTALRRERIFAEARDARGVELRIIDRPAFLFDPTGTIATVRIQRRFISLAVTYVLPRRPGARTICRIDLRTIGHQPGAARVHLGASGWHGRNRRQECSRKDQACHHLMFCSHEKLLPVKAKMLRRSRFIPTTSLTPPELLP